MMGRDDGEENVYETFTYRPPSDTDASNLEYAGIIKRQDNNKENEVGYTITEGSQETDIRIYDPQNDLNMDMKTFTE